MNKALKIIETVLEIGFLVTRSILENKDDWQDIRLGEVNGLSDVGSTVLEEDDLDYSSLLDYHHKNG